MGSLKAHMQREETYTRVENEYCLSSAPAPTSNELFASDRELEEVWRKQPIRALTTAADSLEAEVTGFLARDGTSVATARERAAAPVTARPWCRCRRNRPRGSGVACSASDADEAPRPLGNQPVLRTRSRGAWSQVPVQTGEYFSIWGVFVRP